MESVPFSAGRIYATSSGSGTTYDVNYHLTDQVGSVRAVINGVGEVQQQSDYYAFGLRHASTDFATNDNRYQLTGKESQKDFGFNYLDFHARQYDPTGILFTSQDPLQDKYMSIGSYNYCGGNPINAIDIDGRLIIFISGYNLTGGEPNREFRGHDTYGWKGIDALYTNHFKDNKALYTDGESGAYSSAEDRHALGVQAGNNLIANLADGTIGLAEGETIKLIGYSQGAAYVAGMVDALIADGKYIGKLSDVHYLAPHQVGGISNKFEGARQIGSTDDIFNKDQKGIKGVKKVNKGDWGRYVTLGGHIFDDGFYNYIMTVLNQKTDDETDDETN